MRHLMHGLRPIALPDLHTMLADLGHPPATVVASFLGVDARTVYRWQLAGSAPRPALLALFWLTRWGRSHIECQAINDLRLALAQARCADTAAALATKQNAHLLRVGDFGAANAPLMTG